MNEAVTYSLSISKNGEVINDNIIELNNNNNNIEFDIKFSADKDKYIEDFDLYNLYVMVNFKEIDFFVDNNYCNNIYSFQLNEFERSKEMKIKASLDGIENPNNIIVSILPKECNENNFDHGMLILYDIKNDNQVIKRDYKYTDYKTIKNTYKGMILNQDFDESKDSGFDLIKSLDITENESVKLAFRASNITNDTIENKDYLLLISLNGKVDETYIFKEPSLSEIIYKELILDLNENDNDIIVYLIPIDIVGQKFNQYYIIQRINIK